MVTNRQVHVDVAIKTPQFYLLWVMLCLNVTAGIGILGKASDMLQDIFGDSVAVSSGFVLILSIANMVGRFFGRPGPIIWAENRLTVSIDDTSTR